MEPRRSPWKRAVRGMAALAVLATCGLAGFAHPPGDQDPLKPLPEEVAKAWRDAGAEVGWLGANKGFFLPAVRPEKKGLRGDLPAFRFLGWKEGLLAKL